MLVIGYGYTHLKTFDILSRLKLRYAGNAPNILIDTNLLIGDFSMMIIISLFYYPNMRLVFLSPQLQC